MFLLLLRLLRGPALSAFAADATFARLNRLGWAGPPHGAAAARFRTRRVRLRATPRRVLRPRQASGREWRLPVSGPGARLGGMAEFIRAIPEGDNRERSVCAACGHIAYENPKIVVGSVVVADGQVLLCRRAIEPRRGFWTLPAGYMELGETDAEGAERAKRGREAEATHCPRWRAWCIQHQPDRTGPGHFPRALCRPPEICSRTRKPRGEAVPVGGYSLGRDCVSVCPLGARCLASNRGRPTWAARPQPKRRSTRHCPAWIAVRRAFRREDHQGCFPSRPFWPSRPRCSVDQGGPGAGHQDRAVLAAIR